MGAGTRKICLSSNVLHVLKPTSGNAKPGSKLRHPEYGHKSDFYLMGLAKMETVHSTPLSVIRA